MKILVLGATGATGRLIVSRALAEGHDVVVLARSRARTAILTGVQIFEGDARDGAVLTRAIAGCDAVISALGTGLSPFQKVTMLSRATRALVGVMNAQNVRRLVCITGLGAGDSRGHGGFFFDRLFLPLMLRLVYADKNRQEDVIRASALDWTIVRPTVLNDKPAHGRVRALTDLSGVYGGTIARADVADFVVQQLVSSTWLHKTPLITW
ncbi:NAD(P)-dependent oxidoreductase [Gluconacetobacter liquefaciens]|uniref:Putative NADH-flavin reductase n=1 Tax=Gluconacetobacter liquefaciens TaxID=89584 RepID=A0A370FZS2_GLULI|nr:SDR family oxidoreductase [Gluconacetobacter liquefaciens]MBB2186994.1 SDR family oxidoreductase [Gluconacetobacter liquefaciens]RDI36968.1 putative NADH-flavin reductase [Gluconacetobacter liquefaciens]